mgnify:CR=1 FL=1
MSSPDDPEYGIVVAGHIFYEGLQPQGRRRRRTRRWEKKRRTWVRAWDEQGRGGFRGGREREGGMMKARKHR